MCMKFLHTYLPTPNDSKKKIDLVFLEKSLEWFLSFKLESVGAKVFWSRHIAAVGGITLQYSSTFPHFVAL